MSTDIYSIYKATNIINNKNYIGFTSNITTRKILHKHETYNPKLSGYTSYFHNAIRKYSWDNFVWEILYQSLDREHTLKTMENYFINLYDTFNNGYNMSVGGEGPLGYIPSQESIEKRKRFGILNHFYGKKHSQETLKYLKAMNIGQIPWNTGIKDISIQGNKNPASKLTKENVITIRQLYPNKIYINDNRIGQKQRNGKLFPYERAFCFYYGKQYKVSHKTIDLIIKNKKWIHLL